MGGTITGGVSTSKCHRLSSATGTQLCQPVRFLLFDGDGPAPADRDERQPCGYPESARMRREEILDGGHTSNSSDRDGNSNSSKTSRSGGIDDITRSSRS